MGIAEGPIYKKILGTLLEKRLNGEIKTRGEEEGVAGEVLNQI